MTTFHRLHTFWCKTPIWYWHWRFWLWTRKSIFSFFIILRKVVTRPTFRHSTIAISSFALQVCVCILWLSWEVASWTFALGRCNRTFSLQLCGTISSPDDLFIIMLSWNIRAFHTVIFLSLYCNNRWLHWRTDGWTKPFSTLTKWLDSRS